MPSSVDYLRSRTKHTSGVQTAAAPDLCGAVRKPQRAKTARRRPARLERLDESGGNQHSDQHGKSAQRDVEEIAGKPGFVGQHDRLRSDADRYNASKILMDGNQTGEAIAKCDHPR
jgi:hypothetical protein